VPVPPTLKEKKVAGALAVVGTVALDNVKTPSGHKRDLLGGSAAHFSMSARLFTPVHVVAVVGRDFPEKYTKFLCGKGVNLASLEKGSGSTFRWDGEYKKEDFNTALTLATRLGVLESYVPNISHAHRRLPYVFLANIDPDVQTALLRKMISPRFVGLDSMNLWINIKRKSLLSLMKKVHLFVANDGEARALTGETNLIKAAKSLRRRGPQFVVIKKGEHGVLFYSDRFMFSYPAYPVETVVDPTGAGDTFAGGLMGFLSRAQKLGEKTFRKAIVYATILGSFNVEGFGMAKTAPLTMSSVQQRMDRFLKFISI